MISSFLSRGFKSSGRQAEQKAEPVRSVDSSSKKPAVKGVSRSRSTSVGSSATASDRLQDGQTRSPPVEEQPPHRDAIPDITYPVPFEVPFVIRNTFVDVPLDRPMSLDEFMEERKTNSCPPSAIGLPPGLPPSEVLSEHDGVLLDTCLATAVKKTPLGAHLPRSPQVPQRCSNLLTVPPMDYHLQPISTPFNSDEYPATSIDFMSTGARGPRTFQPMPQPPPPPQWVPNLQEAVVPPPPSATAEQACKGTLLATLSPAEVPRQGQILQLAKALPEPELGTPDCPTLGSRGHGLGNCKPCAFVHTKGCENGTQCIFCHLCEPGEKKRRAKEKKERRRETRTTWSLF